VLFHFSALKVQTFAIKTTCCMDKLIKAWKIWLQKMQIMHLVASTLPGPTGGAYNMDRICIPEKVIKMLHGSTLCTRE